MIYPQALAKAAALLSKHIVLSPEAVTALTSAVIREYQRALASGHRAGDRTKTLAALSPGESVTVTASAATLIRENMRTARKLLSNPQAVWTVSHIEGVHFLVTRLADGERPQRKVKSVRVLFLASQRPGQSALSSLFKDTHSLTIFYKNQARSLLSQPNADWTAHLTNKGVRITRIK